MKRSSASTSTRRLSSAVCSSVVSGWRNAPRLDVLAQPHALAVRGDVLDLVGDRAAVGLAQVRQRVGERRAGHVHAQHPGRDLRHQLGRQAERLGVERRVALGLGAERVEARGEVPVACGRAFSSEVAACTACSSSSLGSRGGRRARPARPRRARRPPARAAAGAARARRRATRRRPRRSRARPAGSSSTSARKRPDSAPWMMRWS